MQEAGLQQGQDASRRAAERSDEGRRPQRRARDDFELRLTMRGDLGEDEFWYAFIVHMIMGE